MRVAVTGSLYRRGQASGLTPLLQCAVHSLRAAPTFVDRPHDQRLTAARVARGEHARRRGCEVRRLCVPALVALDAELLEQSRLGAEKAKSEEHQVGRPPLLGARDRVERRLAGVLRPLDPLHAAVTRELRRRDREVALAALLQRVRDAELQRPPRPRRHLVGAGPRRLADQLDLRHRRGTLAV
jgi:hypothetical protein